MVSPENAVIAACGVVALAATLGGRALTDLGDTVLIGALLVGVIVPQLANGYLDSRKRGEPALPDGAASNNY